MTSGLHDSRQQTDSSIQSRLNSQYLGEAGDAIGDVGEYLGDEGDACAGAFKEVSDRQIKSHVYSQATRSKEQP